MAKKTKCFADGGAIGSDGLTDEQRAKKNAALSSLGISSAPAPVPQPPAQSPTPPPKPQQQGIGSGIIGIFKGRQQQVDKAAGYVNGGKIKGAGTPTSDSIDAGVRETGEQIKVSTDERILSKAQDKLLEGLAKSMGYKSLDAYLEAGTGKPVGPTIKDGKAAAEYGMSPEERDYRLRSGNISGQWIGRSSTPTIGATDQSGQYSDALKSEPSLSNYINRGDPIKDFGTSVGNLFSDSAKAARGNEGTYDDIVTARQARESGQALGSPHGAQTTKPDASAVSVPYGGTADIPSAQNYSNEGRSVPQRITKSNHGVVVDNENQFTQGGKTYTSVPTSQQGISRVTAPGASPLYTNIKPEDAVSDIGKMKSGQFYGTINLAEQNDRLAKSLGYASADDFNKQKANEKPAGVYVLGEVAPGITQADLDNAETKRRWRQDELISLAQRGNQGVIAAVLNGDANYDAARLRQTTDLRGQDVTANNAMVNSGLTSRGQDITMRGQDIAALGDKAKLAMLERNDQRQADKFNLERLISEGQLADSEAQRTARNNLNAAIASGDPAAISKAIALAKAAGLPFNEDKAPKFGEVPNPNDKSGLTKIPVMYNNDGTYTPLQAKQAAPQQRTYAEFEKAYLAKRPGSTPEQIKADYQQLYGAK